jgi:hypothetical protein
VTRKEEKINNELKMLAARLRNIFRNSTEYLKDKKLSDRTLDDIVLNIIKNYEVSEKDLIIKFSQPTDVIYKDVRRAPYDMLCHGKIFGKEFFIFINNKLGNLFSNTRNDITTYNNLLRLYLGITEQRLKKLIIDTNLIFNRISAKEIVSYAVFVIDNEKRGHNFFLLEEIRDDFYINPRNTMFQVRYLPNLGDPIDYYSFVSKLIDATIKSLEKSENTIRTELLTLNKIKIKLDEIKRGIEYGY